LALRTYRAHKEKKMITLTAIVLALGLGWAVIKVWNSLSVDAPKAPATVTAKQG
jgi:hypothetical protein